ncbi:MAG: hypothetical protein ACLVG6_02445 [Dorea formicigenerans]
MKRSASENIWLVIKYVLLIGFTILCIYPLVWLFLASFKTNAELYTNTWGLPEQWSMTNYVNAVVKVVYSDTLETQLLLLFLWFWLL